MQHKFTPTTHLKRAALTLLALIMTCAAAWADNVSTYYIDENGTRHDVTATVVTTYMDDLGTDGETTWYVVNENIFLYGSNNQTYIHGNVNLILADGCELKPACGSNGPNDGFRGSGNLTLYGQTASTGTLSCGQEGFMNITGDFTVCSGMVSVSGYFYNAIRAANFTMRGGSVSITNNTNNDCGIRATGTVNIYSGSVVAMGTTGIEADIVNIYGGSVTARSNGGNAEGSNYGRAIKCSSTFNFYGGNVTVQGDYNWHEGQTRYGIHAGSINLSWTSTADWIYNTKDGNFDNVICYFAGSGSMNIAPYKPFTDGTTTYTGTLTDEQVEALADKTLQPVVPAFAETGDGTPEYPYTIYNATGWGEFCDALQDATYNHFSGKTVKLGANISVTQSAGSNDHRFMGTFDGQEHTLDVDITDTGEQGTAPFRFISNATIRNLHVTGTVTGTTHAAGLVGKAIAGTILIENCLVETNVNSTVGNNRHCGGIVGHGFGGNNPVDLTLRNCVYAGTITCDKNYIGGLQGWSDGNTLTLENCLFAGNYQGTATGTAAFHPIALHNTGSATNLTATNVFAAVAPTATNANFIAADGTKTTGRTTAPAGLGTQGATYSFMDMTVYENGLYYDGLYYVAPTLSTDNSGAYLINNVNDWTNFCDALYNNATWNRFSGQTVKLGADISVSRMAGYDNHDFLGTFDGNHDTLTFTATATASYLAPFRNVLGNSTTDRAVIRDLNVVTNITAHDQRHMAGLIAIVWGYVDVTNCNVTVDITATKGSTNTDLYPAGIASQVVKDAQIAVSGCTVDGTISTDGKYAGGIIGIAQGSASITNSLSSVTINSSTDGDGTHGGFVGVQGNYDGKTITIEGCVFNGSLLGASTHSCGGFLGWRSKTVNISNSLFAPVQVTINTTDGSTPCATFVRNGDSSTTITDCYYTTALGTAQGTQVYSISKGQYVTTLEINGTATQSYTVSGLSFYSTGIKCGDVLFAEANDVVSLILAHQDREGYDFIGYTATAGNLNGSSLTMPDGNVTINAEYTCTAPSELTATDLTPTSATLNWDGYQDSYNVRYRTDHVVADTLLNEGFEGYDLGLSPEGWTTNGEDWSVCGFSHSGNQSVATNMHDSYLISPELEISDNAMVINFWYSGYGEETLQLDVDYRYTYAPNQWYPLWSSEGEHMQWTEASIPIENVAWYLGSIQLGFKVSGSEYFNVYLDDITVNSYTEYGEWQTINNIAATTTPLTGLTPETPYQWQVQGLDCDGNDGTTEWSAMGSFTTLSYCSAPSGLTATVLTPTSATLNWSGYQDSYNVRYATTTTFISEGFESGVMPDGWSQTSSYWQVTSGTGITSRGSGDDYNNIGAATGNYNAGCFIDSNSGSDILITPAIDLSNVVSATLSFNFWNTKWYSDINTLNVYYRVDEGEWNLLYTNNEKTEGWIPVTVTLEGMAANYQIGFECVSHWSYGMGIDDVVVIDNGVWTTKTNVTSPHTISGLTPETQYQWQVQGLDCDGNDSTTEWSEAGYFTTPLHDPVAYINENGEQQLCTEYTVLTGTETTLAAGWYVADSTLNYSQTLILSGDVHLILKDGAVLNVGTAENPVGDGYGITGEEYYSISIYAQSMGDSKGQLHVNAEYHGIYAKEVNICGGEVMTVSANTNGIYARNGNITIYNGHVTSQGGGFHGILAIGDIIINGGQVTSTGRTYGIWSDGGNLTINGGQVTANGGTYGIYTRNGNLTLGWTNASDFIYANNYYVNNGTLSIAEGKTFIDEDGNTFESGTVNASDINGKWLYPDCVVFKQVEGYEDGDGGYCLIASPNVDNTDPATINGMTLAGDDAANYDLYRFDPSNEGSEWVNYKTDSFNLVNGHGYLYARKNTKTLVFTGPFITDTDSVAVDLEYDAADDHKCWNLVGNPFPCEATINKPYYVLNADCMTINPTAIEGNIPIPPCTAVFVKGESGDDRVVFSKVSAPASSAPIGAIDGLFSVSADKQVYFSKGNLQYKPSTATWRFAPNQYDLLFTPEDLNLYHSAVGNYADVTSLYTENYTDWIDFFGWGTSGWNSGANAYMPYGTSYMADDFYPGGDPNNDLTGTCANADWAWYNPISNGGNAANQWRTLTHDEWAYLFSGRDGATSKYGHGSVNGVNGMIILPDNWTLPDGCSFTPGNSDWTNSYTTTEWAAMEAAGAVFLPAAGQRSFGTFVNNVGNLGRYWSSTHRNNTAAYDVWFHSDFISELDTQAYYSNRSMGYSVRPVQDAQ